MAQPILQVQNISVAYGAGRLYYTALDRVSFALGEGELLGLVGESGAGKSTVLRAISGLARLRGGGILLKGREVPSPRDLAYYATVQMVFQDPYGSLHPRHTVDQVLAEPLAIHGRRDEDALIVEALKDVGLGPSFRFRYPHQLSGGQRQRVAIARALILRAAHHSARRADLGARRVGAGGDPEPARGAACRAWSLLHSRQPRPGGGSASLRTAARHAARAGDRGAYDRPAPRRRRRKSPHPRDAGGKQGVPEGGGDGLNLLEYAVMPWLDHGIHSVAVVTFNRCSGMDCRIKSGNDDSGWQSRRELMSPCPFEDGEPVLSAELLQRRVIVSGRPINLDQLRQPLHRRDRPAG